MSTLPIGNDGKASEFHSEEELKAFHLHMMAPLDSGEYFHLATSCDGCHSFDSLGFAMVDALGNDVNIFDDWRTTMMANSAKDPFWRAKVSHEVLINPTHAIAIEDKCTECHAPLGNYTAKFHGDPHYGMVDLLTDSLGQDGVSCVSCHQMGTTQLGEIFSGAINFDTTGFLYGQYPGPFQGPMELATGFTPAYGPQIEDAGVCASCHTLVTETIDLGGNLTGNPFVEQATYHEWLNSIYGLDEISCQSCHMPRLEEGVVISANYAFLQPRSPYGLHELVGANTFMLNLMKTNKVALGIDALDEHFDSTITATYRMLQNKSIDLAMSHIGVANDTAFFEVDLTNKAGHKFPSGYPSRRATIQMIVVNEDGDTLFSSGEFDNTYEVNGHNTTFEPHYQVINQEDQVQIYELVVGDVNGNVTTVLERGAEALKDNRLAPIGFKKSHVSYDTTLIAGQADIDPDFNIMNGQEGSGTDKVHYHIPLNGYIGNISVYTKVYYQSLPPKWMKEMFDESTPEIETFRTMYDAADQSPVLVSETQIEDIFVEGLSQKNILPKEKAKVFPNPNKQGNLDISLEKGTTIDLIIIRNSAGKIMRKVLDPGSSVLLPTTSGTYILHIKTNKGWLIERVVVP